DSHDFATEKRFECMEQLNIAFVVHDGEFRQDLNAGCHLRMRADSDVKTAFAVHKTYDPLSIEIHRWIPNIKSLRVPCATRAFPADCPRVRLILTARHSTSEYRTAVEEIPAYGSVLLKLAMTNLRTVIVTAAVYRGFSSELWLAPDPSL